MFRALLHALAQSTAIIAIAATAGCATQTSGLWQPAPVDMAALQKNAAIIGETGRLNHLTRIAIDANELYGQAAVEADDPELRAELQRLATNHAGFAQDLQQRVSALGVTPAQTGQTDQASGGLNRSLATIRATAGSNSLAAANELHRSESYLIDEITLSLQGDLTPVSRQIVEAELAEIQTDRSRVEQMQARLEAREAAEQAAEDAAADAFHEQPG